MKIVFTGGETGGHFYPIIAIAEELHEIAKERNLLKPQLYFFGPSEFDGEALFRNDIQFRKAPAGKLRRYFSIMNFFDFFKTGWGIIQAIFLLYSVFPDVVFTKGGYGSFPTLVAARILGIPVFVHDSDAIPGRVSLWAGKFADRVAVSYPEATEYFKEGKAVLTGIPARREVAQPSLEGAFEYLKLEENVPTILVVGGSQGAQKINETILSALPDLLNSYQVIHQTGAEHFKEVELTASVILENHAYRNRYKPFDYFTPLATKMAAGAAKLIISRAGSGYISEIALWQKPSIVIPIPESVSRDQRKNAYSYASTKAAVVLEEHNLTPNLLISEVKRIFSDPTLMAEMSVAAERFSKPNAAKEVANELIEMSLKHEE